MSRALPSSQSGGSNWPESATPQPGPTSLAKVSIVTPSLNQGRFIEDAIRSVLLQRHENLEYIVIDGGSTDGSVETIRRYERWLYWVSEPDGGQSDAINKGFARATGEILAWLNADDVYSPGAIATAASRLSGRRRSLLVGASVITFGPDSLEGSVDLRRPTWAEVLYEARSFPQPSVFWTRDLWDLAGPLSTDLYYAMDYELWVRMYPHVQEVIFLDDALSFARTHSRQKSIDGQFEAFDEHRARIALREARRRGQSAGAWLWRSILHDAALSWRKHDLSCLRFSGLKRSFVREAFRRGA
jgi:glycosyltransferase involved in cell wall biosynthesis